MKNQVSDRIVRGIASLVVVSAVGGLTLAAAGEREFWPQPIHFNGLINDYTPSAAVTKLVLDSGNDKVELLKQK